MTVLKCRRCGGNLILINEAGNQERMAECENCGNQQIIPFMDDERKEKMFLRANDLWKACDFDRAAAMYDTISAEFPDEAEAFWGQVLCEYGIEYVKDPATGKRIPTCHRVSVRSVLEDKSYNLALQNAGILAAKKYREDAAEIEQIRKGIIEISNKERPYDIFICYKETDEYGNRTPDSVMAQDVYEELTEKGYRVFFSRITLEDKLGQEYEPYIFAALNSAKIMLVFGTQEDYFQAVWVKNEWSRFLSMMSNGKKNLIACYKYISPYDMPHEFRNLQGLDMGKIGAMQDLLRGIEKIIPIKRTGAGENSFTAGGAQVTIQSLLNRGKMALEDEEWEEALKIFETVLNSDSKCAEAYFGEALCSYKCKSTKDFFLYLTQKAHENRSNSRNIKNFMSDAMNSKLHQFLLPNYFFESDLERIMKEFGNYDVQGSLLKNEMNAAIAPFRADKNLVRAQRFAEGEFAQEFNKLYSDVAAVFQKAIDEAKEQDEVSFQNAWKKVLDETISYRKQAQDAREKAYQRACNITNDESIISSIQLLEEVGDYKDARKRKEELDKLGEKLEDIQDGSMYFLNALIKDQRSELQSYINTCRKYDKGEWDTGLSVGLQFIYIIGYSIVQIVILVSVFLAGMNGIGSTITGFLNMTIWGFIGLMGVGLGCSGFGSENGGHIKPLSVLGYIVFGFLACSYNFTHKPNLAVVAFVLYLLIIPSYFCSLSGKKSLSDEKSFYYWKFWDYEQQERKALNELWQSVLNRDIQVEMKGIDTFIDLFQKTGIADAATEEYLVKEGFELGETSSGGDSPSSSDSP